MGDCDSRRLPGRDTRRVVVVGAGISGLAAARAAVETGPAAYLEDAQPAAFVSRSVQA
jgi:cation diffusion facilitator CzcD-associated flavoprotein CzcO